MASAASSMSANRASSARKDRDRLAHHFLPKSRPKGAPRQQVHTAAEETLELGCDSSVLEQPDRRIWVEPDDDVDVTVRPVVAAGHRPEHRHRPNAPSLRDAAKRIAIDLDLVHSARTLCVGPCRPTS